jgi:hypothetical protein
MYLLRMRFDGRFVDPFVWVGAPLTGACPRISEWLGAILRPVRRHYVDDNETFRMPPGMSRYFFVERVYRTGKSK